MNSWRVTLAEMLRRVGVEASCLEGGLRNANSNDPDEDLTNLVLDLRAELMKVDAIASAALNRISVLARESGGE